MGIKEDSVVEIREGVISDIDEITRVHIDTGEVHIKEYYLMIF